MTTSGAGIIDGGGCPFCFGTSCGSMRLDCKGRPYFTCCGCGTRAFIRSPIALEAFRFVLSNGTNYARMAQAAAAVSVAQPAAGV